VTVSADRATQPALSVDEFAPGDEARSHPGSRTRLRWGTGVTVGAMIVGALVMAWPALAAPINADQRYMYLNVPGRVQGDWLDIVRILWSEIPERAEQGRMTPLGYFIQWLFYNGTTEFSVATGTPLVVLHGAQKVLIFAVAVLSVAAFVKSLRGRTPDGQLVAPSRSTVWLVVGGVVVLGAAGVQTHLQFRNGWLSYPVLTYGAVIVGFGVVALTLMLTRRLAERPTAGVTALAVAAMVGVGIFLNLSYELYYVAFPAALLALLLQPGPTDDGRRRSRMAKLVTGGTLSVTFLSVFVAIRLWLADACVDQCYIGTDVQLGGESVRMMWYNLTSSLPLSGRSEALAELSTLGRDSLPGPFSSPLTIASVLAGAGLVAAWILIRRGVGGEDASDADEMLMRSESGALLRGAVVALALAFGSVAVMSVSAQVPEIIRGVGYPYRHIVITWVGLCVAGLLTVIAIGLRFRNRVAFGIWAATAAVAVLVAGVMLPINMQATRAELLSPPIMASDAIHREITLGDPRPEADERRCETITALAENGVPPTTENFTTDSAQNAYRHFYGTDYCSRID
jgi:hypothetical protein